MIFFLSLLVYSIISLTSTDGPKSLKKSGFLAILLSTLCRQQNSKDGPPFQVTQTNQPMRSSYCVPLCMLTRSHLSLFTFYRQYSTLQKRVLKGVWVNKYFKFYDHVPHFNILIFDIS